ncbi:nucleotidyltransferase family protein [Flavobacteriaceae bacterium]|nr:nucleotidyltransferase family protein [Flavobacteriaceae bacterium]
MHSVAMVILAAGASSRMNRPKALLPWPKESLIRHHLNLLKNLPVDIYICSGKHHKEISDELSGKPVTIFYHENWEKGMGSSIAFSCTQLNGYENLLFIAVDQPLVSTSHLLKIIKTATDKKNHIIYSSNPEIQFSIPVLFPKSKYPDLKLLSNDKGAKKIVQQSSKKIKIEVSSLELSDMDTQEDYNYLFQFAHH